MQLRQPLNLRKPLQMTAHKIRPTLNLPFAASGSLGPLITYTGQNGTYFNSSGTLTAATTNVARFDYNPSTLIARGLLIEEARTNLFLYSADQTNAAWLKVRATVPGTTTQAPDGTSSGQKIVEDSSAATTHFIRQDVAVTNTQVYTASFFLKAGERTQVAITFGVDNAAFTGEAVLYTLTGSGTASSIGAGSPTYSITAISNGWYRCTATATAVATATGIIRIQLADAGSTSYSGNGTSGAYSWGGQLEAGAFATSYIPTTTAAVTRAADLASITGANFTSFWNATQGTIVVGAMPMSAVTNAVNQVLVSADDGTTANRIQLLRNNTSGTINATITVGAAAQLNINSSGALAANTLGNAVLAYQASNQGFSALGEATQAQASGTIPTVTTLHIGLRADSAIPFNGWISSLSYYPVRLTNTQIQTLST